ncbi:MAG: S53 family peptidase, partial [Candidatus Korobacteraceae bacterium]
MRRARYIVCGAILIALMAALAGGLAAQQTVSIPHVPLPVRNGSAHYLGPYNPQQMLRLSVALKPPHMDEEEQFLRQLQDPASPLFHKYLSAAEWNQRFAPSAQDEQAVVAWAQAQGLTITQRFPNRLVVDVEAPVAVIESALALSINSYQLDESTYFSNDRGPSIPAALANVIHSVLGLNNIEVAHSASNIKDTTSYPVYSPGPAYALGPHLQRDGDRRELDAAMAAHRKGVSHDSSNGAYDPTDLYSSYAYNYVALQNLGHCCNPLNNPNNSPPESSIAIAIWGDFRDSDYSGFLATYSYLASNMQRHFVDGTPPCCNAEATLDLEWSTAMSNSFASAASTAEIHVYEGPTYGVNVLLDVLQHALADDEARVLNMSWGIGEYIDGDGNIDEYHSVFNQMIGEGWSLVAAAGDGGSTTGCERVSVSYPASDPDVTAVGGTSLSTYPSSFGQEVAWTGGPYGCSNNDGGTGGGCSVFNSTSYQGGAACSSNMRSVPDVALNSDWVNSPQNFYWDGQLLPTGGTSIATPEMAGFFAQENAYLLFIQGLVGNTCGSSLSAPCAPMGSANPYIYSEGLTQPAPHYPFYDITAGCNNNDITRDSHLGYFCASPGYDRVTGWGSANMLQFAWMINYFLAGDGHGPSASFTGPPVNQWFNYAADIRWTLTDAGGNHHLPNGPAGSSAAWDTDPGNPYSQPAPGAGNNFYGPQFYGDNGVITLQIEEQGCHVAKVRAWDNAGNSALSSYGPLCLDVIPPQTTITLSGNLQPDGNYDGPVLITLTATDNLSGVAATYYEIDGGPEQTYSAPFYVYLPGMHTVNAMSADVAGNYEGWYHYTPFDIEQNQQFALTISKTGTGGGTVTSADGGINCGSTCSANYWDGQPVTLTASPAQGSIFTGWQNCDLSFGLTCTLTVTAARTATAIFNIPVALQFVPVTPCRIVDTRGPTGPFGGPSLQGGGAARSFAIPSGPCSGIPSNAAAYSLNVTAVPHGSLSYLTAWPTGLTQPLISTLNSYDGRVKANAAIVPAGDGEAVSVYATNTTDLLLDIDGYFLPSSSSTLAFFPLTPCRVVDTRNTDGPLGGPILTNGHTRDFPVLQATACNIPSTAQAYSFNYTAIPQNGAPLGYLTTWPRGLSQPVVSTLNAPTGTVTANAAIVNAGQGGDIEVYPYGNNTDLVIDINGYFAPAASGALSLYSFAPCRVLDTRQTNGAFSDELTVNVVSSPCEVPSA